MDPEIVEARGRTEVGNHLDGEACTLELARRAIAAQRETEPDPLDDPWFIE
jgi:hypothetical protein